jgi:hypothetical protein
VSPLTPIADKASRTSSSLNGLMTASSFFICAPWLTFKTFYATTAFNSNAAVAK